MRKKSILLFLIAFVLFAQNVSAKMYECTYKNKYGINVVSSYNTLIKTTPNYKQLLNAYKTGNCRELIVKKYFLDGTICNIQFYKDTRKISYITCPKGEDEAYRQLKEIAKKDYGYFVD